MAGEAAVDDDHHHHHYHFQHHIDRNNDDSECSDGWADRPDVIRGLEEVAIGEQM